MIRFEVTMKNEQKTITNANEVRQSKPNVPTLRFPNYSGEWQVSSMGKVCTFRKGYGISKENLSSDGTPCILYGELYTTYKTAIAKSIKSKTNLDPTILFHSKKNDVIIPCSGETAEDIATSVCIPYDDILLGGDLTVIRSDLDGAFLSNQINSVRKYDIARIAQGKSIVHLQADELKKISIAYPTIDEQQKISGSIDKIDERIEVQNKIISDLKVLKKELCNKVFSKGSAVRLGDFIEEVTTRNKSNSCENVLSVSNKMGFIKQSEQFEDRTVASENKSNYKVVTEGCFAYNPARINVGSIALLSTYKIGIISPMYVCFKTKNTLNSEYLNFYYQSGFFYKELQKKLEGSVRQCLTYENMSDILIPYVDIEKQKAIAATLNKFATLIANEEKYLKLLQKQKSYFLNAMFI